MLDDARKCTNPPLIVAVTVACFLLSRRYLAKFILSQILCIISFFFWRLPTDNDIVEVVEGTGMCIVLRRDYEAEAAEKVRTS